MYKNKLNSYFPLEILQRFCKLCKTANLLFWVLWAYLAMTIKIDNVRFKKTLTIIFMQNVKFISHLFLTKLLQTCYFGYLSHACWPQENNYTASYEILMTIYMQKINLIPHFFLEILHFKESCNLICQEPFSP